MFHPSSQGWLITPQSGQLTVQRETCQGWFDAWKQNMALGSLDESEATAWEPFLPLRLGSCASCMLEVTGSIFSGAQGPDRTHVTSFTCQFSILKPQMPCGPGVRIRSPESLCWVVEILGVQTSPMTSKYVHAISIRLLYHVIYVFSIHDMPSLRHPNAHQRRLIFAYGNLQGSPGDGNGVILAAQSKYVKILAVDSNSNDKLRNDSE